MVLESVKSLSVNLGKMKRKRRVRFVCDMCVINGLRLPNLNDINVTDNPDTSLEGALFS